MIAFFGPSALVHSPIGYASAYGTEFVNDFEDVNVSSLIAAGAGVIQTEDPDLILAFRRHPGLREIQASEIAAVQDSLVISYAVDDTAITGPSELLISGTQVLYGTGTPGTAQFDIYDGDLSLIG